MGAASDSLSISVKGSHHAGAPLSAALFVHLAFRGILPHRRRSLPSGTYLYSETCESQVVTFQVFLDRFATQRPEELQIVFIDNEAFHKDQ